MVGIDEAFELRYKKKDNEFQVLVDFEKYKEFKKNPSEVSVYDALGDVKIFKDQKKGDVASQNLIDECFNNMDEEEILKEILLNGECQIPTSYVNEERKKVRDRVVNYIASNSINPGTKMKYTVTMIEAEVDKTGYNFKMDVPYVKQAEEVLSKVKKSIPIAIEKSVIEVCVEAKYCGPFYGPFRKFGKIIKEYYDDGGNLRIHIEITTGIKDDVIEFIKKNSNNEASYHVSSGN